MSQEAVDDLVRLLDLEPIEVNIFRGVSPAEDRQRIFGGQVAGQALVAAARTVDPDRRVHSLHAYFLRPGDPSIPVLYQVDRVTTTVLDERQQHLADGDLDVVDLIDGEASHAGDPAGRQTKDTG